MSTIEFELIKTERIEATLTMTTTLEQWDKLRKELPHGNWPSEELRQRIQDILDKANKQYWETV